MDAYTNHWNPKVNKCFVLINSTWTSTNPTGEQVMSSEDLYDAFGGQSYATILTSDSLFSSTTVEGCWMGNGDSRQPCKSEAEFNNFVRSYMED
jgi:hypothetical protein